MAESPPVRALPRLLSWLNARLPLTETVEYHATKYYAPKNFNFWYYFGILATVVLGIQLLTGIWLTMSYVPSGEGAFASVRVHHARRRVRGHHPVPALDGRVGFFRGGLSTHVPRAGLRLVPRAAGTAVADRHGHIPRAHDGRLLRLPAALGQHVLLGCPGHRFVGRCHSVCRPGPHGVGPRRLPDVRDHAQSVLRPARGRPATGPRWLGIPAHRGAAPCRVEQP